MRGFLMMAMSLLSASVMALAPTNDDWANRIVIPLASLSAGFADVQSDIGEATVSLSDPAAICKNGDTNQIGNTVWYGLTTGTEPIYLRANSGTSYDNVTVVLTGNTNSGFRYVVGGCNDDGAGSSSLGSMIDGLKLSPNTEYSIMVARPSQTADSATLNFQARLATVRTVTKVSDSNDGSCDGDCSLREAVLAGGGAVVLPAGDYALSIAPVGTNNDGANGDLDISNRSIYLYGAGAGTTIIRAASGFADRLIDLDPAASTFGGTFMLADVSLLGGNTSGAGGCLQVPANGVVGTPNEYLVLDRVVVRNCTALIGGGGINNPGAAMLIRQSSIRDNTAGSGGGGLRYGQLGSNVSIQSLILQSSFTGNTSNANFANGGGGIEVQGNLAIVSSTIAENRARQSGGGILVTTATGRLQLLHSTVARNTADYEINGAGSGGGVRIETSGTTAFVFNNSVLSGNVVAGNPLPTAQDCQAVSATITGASNWLEASDASCVFATPAANTFSQMARLGILGDFGGPTPSIPPLADSPLIDSANIACPSEDQRGVMRPLDGDGNGSAECDRGAFEFNRATDLPQQIFKNGFE